MDKVTNKESGLKTLSCERSLQCADAIEISLLIEKQGLSFYEKAAKNVSDQRVKSMFLRLADEERDHIQILQNKFNHSKIIKK